MERLEYAVPSEKSAARNREAMVENLREALALAESGKMSLLALHYQSWTGGCGNAGCSACVGGVCSACVGSVAAVTHLSSADPTIDGPTRTSVAGAIEQLRKMAHTLLSCTPMGELLGLRPEDPSTGSES